MPLSNNHLLNVVRIVSALPGIASLQDLGIIDQGTGNLVLHGWISQAIENIEVLVGQEYYYAKSELLVMEQVLCPRYSAPVQLHGDNAFTYAQVLLRVMRFRLALVEAQPYTFLFSTLKAVSASLALIEASVSIMNDLATFSSCLLDWPPLQLAVACVHVASLLADVPVPRAGDAWHPSRVSRVRVGWHEALGVTSADVELMGNRILDELLSARSAVIQR